MKTGSAIALAFVFLAGASPALGQTSPGGTQVTGTFGATTSPNETLLVGFTCTGAPTCVGTYNLVERIPECTNTLVETNAFTMTGLNLAQSGAIQGTMTLVGVDNSYTPGANGVCVVKPGATDAIIPYSGTWDLASGTGSITVVAERNFPGAITATGIAGAGPAPVFQMTVQSSINAQTATASATIQFRPQDVGTQGSVFVFAVAPASRVSGGLAAKGLEVGKATGAKAGESCVLAQRTSSGQLVALTAAQLQASISGTLSAAGASVSILDNVSTPTVAGATFYVGYGASGSTMLNNGVFRNAVTVPGTEVCPMLPFQTALWWNPNESGWGLNLNQQGGTVFGTLFTYDVGRTPMWLVMSNGVMQPDGISYRGDLFRTTGPAFNANPFTPIGAGNVTQVGTMTVSFSGAGSGTLQYTVNGASVTKAIQRQVYGSRAATCLPTTDSRAVVTNYQDLWWNAAESGWGLNVTHQDNTLFATLFTYDSGGRGLWLVMPSGARQGDGSYLGDLFRTSGPQFNSVPFTPIGGGDITNVGTMRLRFTDGNNGTLTYTLNGTQVVKAITRQVFSSPVSLCN